MEVNKVTIIDEENGVWNPVDLTNDTVSADKVKKGSVFHLPNGEIAVGSLEVAATEKDVNFYDYDGTLLYSYTKTEFLALTEMPANPSHIDLTAQGWNWTLVDAKSYVADYGVCDIGQMYKTASGLHEFDIELTKVTGLTITFKMAGTTNWGDGTSEVTTDSSTHTYSNYGKYTITCNGAVFKTNMFGQTSGKPNYFCTAVRLGENLTSGYLTYAFCYCRGLQTVIIPHSVNLTWIDQFTFERCYSLRFIVIPDTVTSLSNNTFTGCYSLRTISLPKSITALAGCFYDCYGLDKVALGNSLTTINTTFYGCTSMRKYIIPSSITTIEKESFFNNYSVEFFDFTKFSSIPRLVNVNAFYSIKTTSKIVVPDNLYSQWIAETNWVSLADYIYKTSEVNL